MDVNTNLSNYTNVTEIPIQPHTFGAERFVIPVVFGIIFIAGFFGNGILMYIVARNKSMRNVPNMFIFSLALGDFMLIVTSVPMSATIYTVNSWNYGWFMCKVNYFMQTLSLIVSVFTLTALSVERFMAIIRPMSKRMSDPRVTSFVVLACIWFFALVLAIPDVVATTFSVFIDKKSQTTIPNCFNYPRSWATFAMVIVTLKFVILFLVPVIIITLCYVCMAVALVTSGQRMPGEDHGNATHRKMIAARRKVAGIVLSFSVLFVICWMPRYIFLLWFYYNPEGLFDSFWYYFKLIGLVLTFVNSCVNPFALYFLSAQFRNYYKRYLCLRCLRNPRRSGEQSTTLYNFNSAIRRNSTSMSAVQTQC